MSESKIDWHENEYGHLEGYVDGDKSCDPTYDVSINPGGIGKLYIRYHFDEFKSAKRFAQILAGEQSDVKIVWRRTTTGNQFGYKIHCKCLSGALKYNIHKEHEEFYSLYRFEDTRGDKLGIFGSIESAKAHVEKLEGLTDE